MLSRSLLQFASRTDCHPSLFDLDDGADIDLFPAENTETTMEYYLWSRVLMLALHDAKLGSEEALAWFNDATEPYIGCFTWVCQALGLDAGAVRRAAPTARYINSRMGKTRV